MKAITLSDLNKKHYDIIFTDSKEALDSARENGLSDTIPVFSFAPVLCNDPMVNTTFFQDRVHKDQRVKLGQSINDFCLALKTCLEIEAEIKEYIPMVLHTACRFQNLLEKMIYLKEEDYDKNILLLSKNNALGKEYKGFWGQIGFKSMEYITFDVSPVEDKHPLNRGKVYIGQVIQALKEQSSIHVGQALTLPVMKRFWKNKRSKKGNFLIYDDSPLIRETAFYLIRKGAGVAYIRKDFENYIKSQESLYSITGNGVIARIKECILPIVKTYFSEWLASPFVDHVTHIFMGRIEKNTTELKRIIPLCEQYVKGKYTRLNIKGLLTIMPKRPEHFALFLACQKYNIPFITFQHGISREISSNPLNVQAMAEETQGNYFITFNEKAKEIAAKNPFAMAQPIAVGVPQDFFLAKKKKFSKQSPKVFYVSTLCYSGFRNIIRGGKTDNQLCDFELNILQDLLAHIPHDVIYKAYPQAPCYPDLDPVLAAAGTFKNIEIFNQNVDFRFLSKYADVIITSRATSTLSYCLLSGIPLIYIDIKDSLPLREEVVPLMKKALFYFDSSASHFCQDILGLLSLNIEKIGTLYKEKQENRNILIKKYFGSNEIEAGKKTTEILLAL